MPASAFPRAQVFYLPTVTEGVIILVMHYDSLKLNALQNKRGIPGFKSAFIDNVNLKRSLSGAHLRKFRQGAISIFYAGRRLRNTAVSYLFFSLILFCILHFRVHTLILFYWLIFNYVAGLDKQPLPSISECVFRNIRVHTSVHTRIAMDNITHCFIG